MRTAGLPLLLREALWLVVPLAAALAALLWLLPWVAVVPAALLAWTAWFFRDPERAVTAGPGEVVSPADGTVMSVTEVDEPRHLRGPAVCVRIYLALYDVHVNRAPVAGEVAYRDYVRGGFAPASSDGVGERNERAFTGLVAGPHRVLVVQIAGRVARRIVTWPRVGERLERGQRFGLIRFGSCTQLYLPAGSTVFVAPGDKVRGASGVIGRLPSG